MLSPRSAKHREKARESKATSAMKLLCCFAVIHVNTSVSVLLRARILSPEHHGFNHPTFLVLAANLLSFLLAAIICRIRLYNYELEAMAYRARKRISVSRKPAGAVVSISKVPLLQFALMSVSDCLGRNLQIHTRTTTTFPLQVVGRSVRVLPTMLLGHYLLGTNKYSRRDFLDASILSAAVAVFALSSRVAGPAADEAGVGIGIGIGGGGGDGGGDIGGGDIGGSGGGGNIGVLASASAFSLLPGGSPWNGLLGLLSTVGYSVCDAFTWTWQSRLYRAHHVDQYTVMLWLNACQMAVIGSFLLLSGGGVAAVAYLIRPENRDCLWKVVNLAFCSAVSQLMALYTIRRFGPVAFTALRSARQLVAVAISALACLLASSLGALCSSFSASSVSSSEAGGEDGVLQEATPIAACASLGQVRRAMPTASIIIAFAVLASWIRRSAPLRAAMLSRPAEIVVDQWRAED